MESYLSLVLHDQIDLEMLKCADFYFRAAVKLCKVNRLPIFLKINELVLRSLQSSMHFTWLSTMHSGRYVKLNIAAKSSLSCNK